MTIKLKDRTWGATENLETEEDIIGCLETRLEEDHPSLFGAARGYVVRAKGIAETALDAGFGSVNLYKALRQARNSEFAYVRDLIKVPGSSCLSHQRR